MKSDMPKRKAEPESSSSKRKKCLDDKTIDKELNDIKNSIEANLPNALSLTENLIKNVLTHDESKLSHVFSTIYTLLCTYKNKNAKIPQLLKNKVDYVSFAELRHCANIFLNELRLIKNDTIDRSLMQLSIVILTRLNELNDESDETKAQYGQLLKSLLELKLNETLALELFKILKDLSLTESQSHSFLQRLFDENEIVWKASSLTELFHSLTQFSSTYKTEREFVYESIILYFHKLNTQNPNYLENKAAYKAAEVAGVDLIVKAIKNDLSMSSGFIERIKVLLDSHVKDKYLTRFTVALILNLTQTIHRTQRSHLMQSLINTVQILFDIDEKCRTHEWIATSLGIRTKSIQKQLQNLFEFSRVNELVDETHAYKALIDFSIHILDLYGVHITNLHATATMNQTWKHSMTVFSTNILFDLFHNCLASRELILRHLLQSIELTINNESIDLSQSVFFDQLELLFAEYKCLIPTPSSSLSSQQQLRQRDDSASAEDKIEKFILKYFLKSLFTLNSLCAIKLLNIFDLYLGGVNSNQVKHLIEAFRKNLNDDNLETRKTSIYGLTIILRQAVSKEQQQQQQQGSSKTQTSDLIKAKCMPIFDLIKEQLLVERDFTIKSFVYQSLCKIASSNLELMECVLSFFTEKVQDYLAIHSTQTFIQLDKCLSYDHGKLIEPFDLLLHCAFTCLKSYKKLDSDGHVHDVVAKIETLCVKLDGYLQSLTDTLLNNDSKYIFSVYSKQIGLKFHRAHVSPTTASIKIQHQLQLGLIDVLIERQYCIKSYNTIIRLLEKYEQMSNLISVEIEEFMSPIMTPKSLVKPIIRDEQKQRKHTATATARKVLFADENRENKENSPSTTPVKRPPQLPVSSSLRQTPPQTPTPTKTKTSVQCISFANIKFDHTHRVSYTALLNMIRTCLSGDQHADELINEDSLDSLIDLIINENFIIYLNQIVESKLTDLVKVRNIQSVLLYDPESLDSSALLQFLLSLFEIFWQRVHGTTRNNAHIFQSGIIGRYSSSYLNRILKYLKFIQYIWNILFKEHSNIKLLAIFKREGSANQVLKSVLKDCMDSFSNYNQIRDNNAVISEKIRSALLLQIYELTDKFEIENPILEALFKWLTKQLCEPYSEQPEIGKNLMKVVFHVSDLLHTPAIYLKYLLMDFEQFSTQIAHETSLVNAPKIQLIKQFNLFTRDNSYDYFKVLMEEQYNIVYTLEWFLTCNNKFQTNDVMESFYSVLNTLTISAYHCLRSIYNTKIVESIMESLARFYNFMIIFLKHREQNGVKAAEKYLLKELIKSIATLLQENLATSFNRIQRYMLNDEQQREGKADANEITSILRNKHSIRNLISRIEDFEQALRQFSSNYKDINFMEKYTKFISNVEIKLHSRITRTISEQQINKIISSKQTNG